MLCNIQDERSQKYYHLNMFLPYSYMENVLSFWTARWRVWKMDVENSS